MKAKYEISPLQGIRERAAKEGIEVRYVRGYVGDVGGEYNGVTTSQDLRDDRTPAQLTAEAVKAAKEADLVGNMASEGTTPRQLTDLLGSLCDLTSGSGDKGTPIIWIQGYFDNYTM